MAGLLAVILGPSGVGKSTISRALLERFRSIGAVEKLSSTTRLPRPGECDGVDYRFITREVFEEQIARGEFLEWAEYGCNLYGTNRHVLAQLRANSPLVLSILEVQGCRQLKNLGLDPLFCPIIPDDMASLEERVRARPAVNEAEVISRLEVARGEIAAISDREFGAPIVNRQGHLEETIDEIQRRIERFL
jgi:guanylate kinase